MTKNMVVNYYGGSYITSVTFTWVTYWKKITFKSSFALLYSLLLLE